MEFIYRFCIHQFNMYWKFNMNIENINKNSFHGIYKRYFFKCRIKQTLYTKYKLTNNDNDLLKYKLFTNSLTNYSVKIKELII